MDEKEKRELLKSEYLHIQSVIEAFDQKALNVKAWSVSFSLAAIAGAFASDSSAVFLIASGSAFVFWLLEGQWKTFQYAYYERSGRIEKYFAGLGDELDPMQIGSSWFAHWKKGGMRRLLRMMSWPHVALPHLVVLLAGLLLYVATIAEMFTSLTP